MKVLYLNVRFIVHQRYTSYCCVHEQVGNCKGLLSSISASIGLIVVAQYTLNIMLVVRQSSVTGDLSLSPPPSPGLFTATSEVHNASVGSRRLHDDGAHLRRVSWTFARLPHIFRRRVLEYFNPGRIPTSTARTKPLCPLPGISLNPVTQVDRKGAFCVIANQRSVGDSYAYF